MSICSCRSNNRSLDSTAYATQDVLQCYADKYNVIFAMIADDPKLRKSVMLYEIYAPKGCKTTDGMVIYPLYSGVADKFDYYVAKPSHFDMFIGLLEDGIEVRIRTICKLLLKCTYICHIFLDVF